jgi:hypothetical protein
MQYVANPPNPWLTHSVEWLGEPPENKLEVFEETDTRSIAIAAAFMAAPTVSAGQLMNISVTELVLISIARLWLR